MKLRAVALLVLAVVVALGAMGGSALARERPRGAFVPGVVDPPPLGLALHDRVILGPAEGPGNLVPRGVDRRKISTSDGYTVTVETSPRYVADARYDETLVGFLDSLLHGSELDDLTVYVAPPKEMATICGWGAAACYWVRRGTMYIVGERAFGGFPTSYVVAHEYGHRIENYRRNPPFPGGALLWGTKRWATAKHVCDGYLTGRYAPGNEGRKYFRNPGEAFAESYAWSQFGRAPDGWEWTHSLRPTPSALAAIRADVLNPWKPVRRHWHGRLTAHKWRHVYVLRPLDGKIQARLKGGPGLELSLLDRRGHLVEPGRGGAARQRLTQIVCGERKLLLLVRATRTPARFSLDVKLP
jgi:hypothetical protein